MFQSIGISLILQIIPIYYQKLHTFLDEAYTSIHDHMSLK